MITVIIIGYNTCLYLDDCLNSLLHQTAKIEEIIYIDNNSVDTSVKYVEMNFPMVKIIQNSSNFGYAKAANQGIELAKGDYIMILNPDMILEPAYLTNALLALEINAKTAAVGGKIYKYDCFLNDTPKIIDTTGLVALRSRRFLDIGAALNDNKTFERPAEIFGVSGNCPLFRKTALMDAKIGEEYFDEHFFMYKEDVDLCWRLRLFGWSFSYTPYAIGYHKRGTGVKNRMGLKNSVKTRKELNDFQKYYSFKNHQLMLLKNELWDSFIRDFIWIISREISIIFWVFLLEPNRFNLLIELCKQIKPILIKRSIIMKKKRISFKEIMPWFRGKTLIT